jgi:hypothetical protein
MERVTKGLWSYYHKGTLYCSDDWGGVQIYEIGSLSN